MEPKRSTYDQPAGRPPRIPTVPVLAEKRKLEVRAQARTVDQDVSDLDEVWIRWCKTMPHHPLPTSWLWMYISAYDDLLEEEIAFRVDGELYMLTDAADVLDEHRVIMELHSRARASV